jgi:type I restriction enzyme M protein
LIEFGKDQECITVPDDYLKNHIISKNHMVISKMAAPTFKTAIYNNEKDKPVMASGNLFVIEFDENKVNPYYVQAYFDSEAGEAAIQYAAVGSTSNSISMDAIKNVIIPLTSLEKQNQIAKEYQKALSEYAVLKNEIQKVNDRKRNLL